MITCRWSTVSCLLLLLLLFGVLRYHGSDRDDAGYIRERYDTVRTTVTIPLLPLQLWAMATRTDTLQMHDTVFVARCLDTVISNDTLSVCYGRDLFAVSLRFAARRMPVAIPYVARDSIVTHLVTRPWYEDVLMMILAVAAGIVIGTF